MRALTVSRRSPACNPVLRCQCVELTREPSKWNIDLIHMKILFMDKVLLSRMKEPVRGVEIFNLRLIRDLVAEGDEVTLPLHSSWVKRVELKDSVTIVPVDAGRKSFLNGLCAAWKIRRSTFDVMLRANVANGLLPAISFLKRSHAVNRCVLIAHREPSKRFLSNQKKMPTRVVSVNSMIARQFADAGGYEMSEVYYGVTDSEGFHPSEGRDDSVVMFFVLGQLDNAWKGADTAISAFRRLRKDGAVKCELHLASFSEPAQWEEEGIVPHAWMPAVNIAGFVRDMHVMVVPSRDEQVMRETFSQAIVQGMLCGLPVIVNDLPILTEKLDKGGGRIFKDDSELASHMKELAFDADLRANLGAEARATALERYVWDTAVFRQKYLV